MSRPDCHQQDEKGWWFCIVMAGYWDEKLRIDVEEKELLVDEWLIEETRSCIICGESEISYPL